MYIEGPPGKPNPCPCGCTVNVIACGGLNLAGASVEIKSAAGVTLDSGITDGGGNFATTAGCGSGLKIIVSKSRFNTTTFTNQLLECGAGVTLDMSGNVATGYVCTSVCPDPVATTLHGTHPKFGAITYVYNATGSLGGGWYATVSYSYVGCFCCPAKTVTVTAFLDTSFNYSEKWKSN